MCQKAKMTIAVPLSVSPFERHPYWHKLHSSSPSVRVAPLAVKSVLAVSYCV